MIFIPGGLKFLSEDEVIYLKRPYFLAPVSSTQSKTGPAVIPEQ